MKKLFLIIALAVLFIAGINLTSCKSPTQKAKDAKKDVVDASEDLNNALQKADTAILKAADDKEWKTFKIDADAKIKKNELHISELKTKLIKPGKELDEADKHKIDALETRNAELENRMNEYEKNRIDWESFKREFNIDMAKLENAIMIDTSEY